MQNTKLSKRNNVVFLVLNLLSTKKKFVSNTFGKLFRLTTFGESHGSALGGIIDGCPSGLEIDFDFIQSELDRRKPGQSKIVSQRKENDKAEFLSGIIKSKDAKFCVSTGAPIGFIVKNENQKPKDYEHIQNAFRPSHADYTYFKKYGIPPQPGGGRASARETVCRVVGGAVAKLFLKKEKISISAFVSQVGNIKLLKNYKKLDLSNTELNSVRCPDPLIADAMLKKIEQIKKQGDTIGGVVSCVITGVPAGFGEPVFDKLNAELAKAIFSIPAVKGFETGSGFDSVKMKGSEHNDIFYNENGKIRTKTNFSGGIQGGISNGEDIFFRVAFKPVSTIMQKQKTVNLQGEEVEIIGKGRHDPCVVPRAVPVVEAMAALVMADYTLIANKNANR